METIKNWIIEKVWKKIRRTSRLLWYLTLYGGDLLVDAIGEYVSIIRQEGELFFGTALLLLGLLSFESSKYCDGNTIEYLSCTRPATYYYFDWLDISCVILGVFFLMFWRIKRQEGRIASV